MTDASEADPRHGRVVPHGRRAGRPLRDGQRLRVERLLPGLLIPSQGPLDPATLFPFPVAEVRLEIGFGGGEHLAAEAAARPDVGFLGCEPFRNGVAHLIEHIEARGLRNVRLLPDDATPLIDRLPDACLSRVDLLYPDPWPKRRQRKRRFVSDANLVRLARVMRPGADLRFATDIDDYAGWTLAHAFRSEALVWTASTARDWSEPWPGWEPTRYERKARLEGRRPAYLTFERR